MQKGNKRSNLQATIKCPFENKDQRHFKSSPTPPSTSTTTRLKIPTSSSIPVLVLLTSAARNCCFVRAWFNNSDVQSLSSKWNTETTCSFSSSRSSPRQNLIRFSLSFIPTSNLNRSIMSWPVVTWEQISTSDFKEHVIHSLHVKSQASQQTTVKRVRVENMTHCRELQCARAGVQHQRRAPRAAFRVPHVDLVEEALAHNATACRLRQGRHKARARLAVKGVRGEPTLGLRAALSVRCVCVHRTPVTLLAALKTRHAACTRSKNVPGTVLSVTFARYGRPTNSGSCSFTSSTSAIINRLVD